MKTPTTKARERRAELKELEEAAGAFEGVFGPLHIVEVTESLNDLQESLDDYDLTFAEFMRYVLSKMDVISMNINEDWA